ncbi:hypothetical protein LCGC14_2343610, partial [marine sediment metagenome]
VIGDTGGSDNYIENTTIVGVNSAADLFCEVVQNFGDVRDKESRDSLAETADGLSLSYYICEDEIEAKLRQRWFENLVEDDSKPYAISTEDDEIEWRTFEEMVDFFEKKGAEDREEEDRFNLWYEVQKAKLLWPEQQALDVQLRAVLSFLQWSKSSHDEHFYDYVVDNGFTTVEGEFLDEIIVSLRRFLGDLKGEQ